MDGAGKYLLKIIKARKENQTAISEQLGVTRQGFNKMLVNESISANNYLHVCRIIGLDPCKFMKLEGQVNEEFHVEDGNAEKIDTETKEFYQRQIESLTQIILNLSKNGQS